MKSMQLWAKNVGVTLVALLGGALAFADAQPAKLSVTDLLGGVFEHPEVVITEHAGQEIFDFTSLKSSDGKFASGVYKSGPQVFDITEPYGVDEFMYFLSGSVTLTSTDGSVMTVHAGEAITMPKEWTGTWDTDGFEKIWVIHSSDD